MPATVTVTRDHTPGFTQHTTDFTVHTADGTPFRVARMIRRASCKGIFFGRRTPVSWELWAADEDGDEHFTTWSEAKAGLRRAIEAGQAFYTGRGQGDEVGSPPSAPRRRHQFNPIIADGPFSPLPIRRQA